MCKTPLTGSFLSGDQVAIGAGRRPPGKITPVIGQTTMKNTRLRHKLEKIDGLLLEACGTPSLLRDGPLDAVRFTMAAAAIILGSIIFSFRFTSFLHAKELVIYLLLIALSVATIARGRINWLGFKGLLPVWFFIAACAANAAFGPVHVRINAFSEVLRWLAAAGFGVLIYDLASRQSWRRNISLALEISVVGVAILGIIQYFGLMPGLFPVFPHYTQRVYSVFGNQDLYGGYVAMGIPLVLSRERRGAAWPLMFLLIFALLLSASRSSWLAACAGFVMWLFSDSRPRKTKSLAATTAVAAIVIGTFVAPQATLGRIAHTFTRGDEGYASRVACWRAGWELFTRGPLLGAGLGNYAYWSPSLMGKYCEIHGTPAALDLERHADHPHSEPVRLLAESGLIGFLCAAWLVWQMLRRKSPERAPLLAFTVFALFNGLFLSTPHLLAALTLWTLLISRGDNVQPSTALAPRATPLLFTIPAALLIWITVPQSLILQKALDAQAENRPALSFYRKAAACVWANAESRKELGIALMAAGKDGAARTELAAALKGLDTGDIYLALAAVSARQKDFQGARRFARQCARRWPQNDDVQKLIESLDETAMSQGGAAAAP